MRRLTERRRWWLLFILAAGCRSADPDRDPERTIPVSVQVRASPKRSEAPLNAEFLAGELAAAFRAGSIFSEVRSDDGSRPGFSPLPADYLCEVEVRGATLRPDHSETTERAILSTVAWFFTVFPAWWIADRLYPASDVEVRATFLPAGEGNSGKAVPVLSENLPLNNLELDLRRRGNAWQHLLSLLLPPFWMEDAAVAERGLREEAVRVARVSLPEGVRKDWPGAALASDSGAILILDPPRPAIEARGGRADLSAWLAARGPLLALRVFGEDGAILGKFDRPALQALLVPPERTGGPAQRGWQAVRDRLGESSRRPQALYHLELKELEVGTNGRIRVEGWTNEKIPARFTVRVVNS